MASRSSYSGIHSSEDISLLQRHDDSVLWLSDLCITRSHRSFSSEYGNCTPDPHRYDCSTICHCFRQRSLTFSGCFAPRTTLVRLKDLLSRIRECCIPLSNTILSRLPCSYQLLQTVNIAHLFPDDKTFVDKVVVLPELAVTGMTMMM